MLGKFVDKKEILREFFCLVVVARLSPRSRPSSSQAFTTRLLSVNFGLNEQCRPPKALEEEVQRLRRTTKEYKVREAGEADTSSTCSRESQPTTLIISLKAYYTRPWTHTGRNRHRAPGAAEVAFAATTQATNKHQCRSRSARERTLLSGWSVCCIILPQGRSPFPC